MKATKIASLLLSACLFFACGGTPAVIAGDAGTDSADMQICAPGNCLHGQCQGAKCVCENSWFGPDCETKFDTSGYLVSGTVCPKQAETFKVPEGNLKGLEITIPKGAVPACSIVVAKNDDKTLPPLKDGTILKEKILTIHAIDASEPVKNGKLNTVPLSGTAKFFYPNGRFTLLYLNETRSSLEPILGYEFISEKDNQGNIIREGVVARTDHFSSFVPADHKPNLVAKASKYPQVQDKRRVEIDPTGTTDEAKTSLYMLKFRVESAYRPFALEPPVSNKVNAFDLTGLNGGLQTLTVSVTDPQNNKAEKKLTVFIDLCSGVQCGAGKVCREVDGICAQATNLCDPNPCGAGTCSVVPGNVVVCSCNSDRIGQLCGFPNLCKNRDCNSRGTCDQLTGECECIAGWTGMNCEKSNLCNGVVCQNGGKCDRDTGICTCDYQYHGNLCEKVNQCWSPGCDKNKTCEKAFCSNHGLCDKSTGACTCVIDKTAGETKSKYTGAKCDQCASHRFQNYPSCDPILPCNLQCQNGSTCKYAGAKPVCACLPGYSGNLCETKDLCYGVTCPAHANCEASKGTCVCDSGFAAPNCDKCEAGYVNFPFCFQDLCTPNPCKNGGTCAMVQAQPKCGCPQGWTGDFCEKADLCFGVSCPTNSACTNGKCVCNQGWLPPDCKNKDLCIGVTCGQYSSCIPLTGKCQCFPGYTGANCDSCAPGYINYPNCTLDYCNPDPCNGHGSCKDGNCTCTPPWTGKFCDQ